jgi:hypothetical protein
MVTIFSCWIDPVTPVDRVQLRSDRTLRTGLVPSVLNLLLGHLKLVNVHY